MEQLNNNEYNILVVEDDKEIRDGIEIFLKSQGYHVYKAADGVEGLQIIEKEPCKCIKFATTTSPLPFNLWIQIVPDTESECKMKLTICMELNPFMKTMVQKPLQEGLEKMAETLSMINY